MKSAKPKETKMVPLGQAGIERELIEAQVERLRHSAAFEGERNAQKVLKYVAECSLEGKTPSVKEIAMEALNRQAYDPGDASVRNAANKARSAIKAHYASKDVKPGELLLEFPQRKYVIYTPHVEAAEAASSKVHRLYGRVQAEISEPQDRADVYAKVPVSGRIDMLHLDLRPWLVVFAPDGWYYPQCRVSRQSPEWNVDIRIGRMTWGESDGFKFEVLLVAADYDGDFAFHEYQKARGDGFGTSLPSDMWVLDRKRITRRDERPGQPRPDLA